MAAYPQQLPTVVLVDDHRAVREATAQLLEEYGLAVRGQASGREEALACVAVELPDLALVDLSLGDGDGLAVVADLHRLGVAVVVCSSHEDPKHVRQALDLGARAYVAKRDAGRALVRTLRDVLDGWILVTPHAASGLPECPYPTSANMLKPDATQRDKGSVKEGGTGWA